MSDFRIADKLPINLESLKKEGKRWIVAGKTGEGKSNTLLVLARAYILAGWTVAVIDPMNNFRKLRDTGLPVVVAGSRKSADVPLANSAALAGFSFDERASMVLDTSMIEKERSMELVGAFLEALWTRVQTQDEDGPFVPYALFIDEAPLYLPQNRITPVTLLLNDMAMRGRQLHLSMVISSQRLTSIQKDTVLMAHASITHKVSRNDVNTFAAEWGMTKREAHATMVRFVKGQAVFVADSDIADFGDEEFAICRIDEFGGAARPRAELADTGDRKIDVEALREALKEPVEASETGSEAAQAVRERDALIATLRRENLALILERGQKPKVEIQPVEVSVLRDEHVGQLRQMAEQFIAQGQLNVELGTSLIGKGQEILLALQKIRLRPDAPHRQSRPDAPASNPSPFAKSPPDEGLANLKLGARRMLKALHLRHPHRFNREELAVLSLFNEGGGGYSTYLSSLRTGGYIGEERGLIALTPAGLAYAQADMQTPAPPATTPELVEAWKKKRELKGKTKDMLDVLASIYPNTTTRQELAASVGMEERGGGFNTYLSILRSNRLAVTDGPNVRASDSLFVDVMVRHE